MATIAIDGTDAPRTALAPARWWWVRVVGIFSLARLLNLGVGWYLWHGHLDANPHAAHPGSYSHFISRLSDGKWYHQIVVEGYPPTLPTSDSGHVLWSAWAFYPGFPMIVKALMRVTGLPWDLLAPLLAIVFSAAAMLVVHRLIVAAAPHLVAERPWLPDASVMALCLFPSAPVFMLGYADALGLLLIASALLLLVRRRYLAMVPVVLVLGLVRPVGLPMVAVVLVHAVHRYWLGHKGDEPAPRLREGAQLAAAAVAAMVGAAIWPTYVAHVLGGSDAYMRVQSAWRTPKMTTDLFGGWWPNFTSLLGQFGFIAFVAVIVLAAFTPFSKRLGPELQTWWLAYTVYIFAVSTVSPSFFRFALPTLLLPMFMVAPLRRRWARVVLYVALAASQVGWLVLAMSYGWAP